MTTVLRSVLYMPGANDRALEKAKTIPCDGLILDLEDSVAPDAKPAAREAVCAAASSGEYGRRTVTIRVNSLGTEWHDADLAAAAKAGPDGIVVPKVNSAAEVLGLVEAMEKAGAPEHTKLWAMVETPEAIFNAREIAAASDRLAVIVMGTNDLVKELYAEHVPGRAPLLASLSMALLAARAAGVALAAAIREQWPEIAILVSSGRVFPSEAALPQGVGFLAKPWRIDEVVNRVAELL